MLGSRKNHEVYTTALGRDVLEAIRWHIDQGYCGTEVPVQPGRDLSQAPRQPQATAAHRAEGARATPTLSPPDRPSLDGQPSRHQRSSDQSRSRPSSGTARRRAREVYAHLGEQCSTAPRSRRSNRRHRHIVVNIWSTRAKSKIAKRVTTRNHWSGRLDSNQRPHAPKACALPGCATPRDLRSTAVWRLGVADGYGVRNSRRMGTSLAAAFARWLISFLVSGPSSAIVCAYPSGTNRGS